MHASATLTRGAFWAAAAVVAHTLWTSAAPSMSYPLYASTWGLSHAQTTTIFAVYPIVVAVVLTFFGDMSAALGRRRTLLLGLTASLIGTVIFAIGPSFHWLLGARALTAVGVGLTAAPSSAALAEYLSASKRGDVGTTTAAAQAVGLISAFLLGGALVQYAPLPLHLNYIVLALFISAVIILAASSLTPDPPPARMPTAYVRIPSIRGAAFGVFVTATLSATVAYAVSSLFFSLGAQIAKELVGSDNALVNGAALSVLALFIGATAIVARRIGSRTNLTAGSVFSVAALWLLVESSSTHSLGLLLASVALTGAAYSLLLAGSLNLLAQRATSDQLGALLSALYLSAYVTIGVVALGLGQYASRSGLHSAIFMGAIALSILTAILLMLTAILHARRGESLPKHGAARVP